MRLLITVASSVSAVISLALKTVLFSPKCYNAVSQNNRPSCQPPTAWSFETHLPPDHGELAVSTHASLAEWGILDFLDVLCHCLGGSQVLLMISILK